MEQQRKMLKKRKNWKEKTFGSQEFSVISQAQTFANDRVYVSLGDTTKSKLQSIQDRAQRIVARDSSITLNWDSLEQTRKKRISIDVFKSVNGICTESLKNIFTKFDHGKNTHGNGSLLVLPKVRCESGRRTFAFQGASIYNNLPSDVRNEKYFVNFKRKLNTLCF